MPKFYIYVWSKKDPEVKSRTAADITFEHSLKLSEGYRALGFEVDVVQDNYPE